MLRRRPSPSSRYAHCHTISLRHGYWCMRGSVLPQDPLLTRRGLSVFVGEAHVRAADLQAERACSSLRLLPCLLTTQGGEVEVRVAVMELFDTAAERGVGVVHLSVDLEEGADAGPVAAQRFRPGP